jgi:hypothetical protein
MKKITLLFVALFVGIASFAQITLTHNLDNVATNDILCTSIDTVADNEVYSEYDLINDYGVTMAFEVTEVSIQINTGGTNGIPGPPEPTITVNIWSNDGVFPAGNLTLQGSALYTVTAADLDTDVVIPVSAVVPFGENLVYQIVVPDHNPELGAFRFGINDPMNGKDSWIQSVACSLLTPGTLTDLGFPSVYIMSVTGDEVLGVDDVLAEAVSIYPNPVNDLLTVDLPSNIEVISANLYDVLGKDTNLRLVDGTINTSNLARGVYILNINTDLGSVTQKIVKQ